MASTSRDLKIGPGQNAAGEEVAIGWGIFVNAMIVFVVVAFVVYLIATMFIKEAPPPDPTKEMSVLQGSANFATWDAWCLSA